MRKLNVPFLILLIFASFSCSRNIVPQSAQKPHLKFLDVYVIPHNLKYQNTVVGGLSGIDYDKKNNQYYIISDERSATSPARFYTATIHIQNKKIKKVDFTSVNTLKQPDGNVFPSMKENPHKAPDPESIRFNSLKNILVWSSEGDKAVRNGQTVLQDPFIYEMDLTGHFKDSFFIPHNLRMQPGEAGPRTNGVFEGLSYDKDFKHLYVSVEEPLYEDGPRADVNYAGAPIRIIKFDVQTRKPIAQYAYKLDAVARKPLIGDAFRINGVPEILWLADNKLLILERSFSTGILSCTIKVYLADLSAATDVSEISSLTTNNNYTPVSKKLLLNMDDLKRFIDNVEGLTFGPVLPNGHQSLIFVADNNFQLLEKNQVFLFEIIP